MVVGSRGKAAESSGRRVGGDLSCRGGRDPGGRAEPNAARTGCTGTAGSIRPVSDAPRPLTGSGCNRRQGPRTGSAGRSVAPGAAAAFRAVEVEGRDHHPAVGLRRLFQGCQIGRTARGLDQEMEDRPIMPDIVLPRRRPGRDVGDDPADPVGALPEPLPRLGEGAVGDIEDSDIGKAAVEQFAGQMRCAATNINDGGRHRIGAEPYPVERLLGKGLKPVDLVLGLALVDVGRVALP